MEIRLFGLLLLFVFSPLFTHAEEVNAGFVQGLWYSEETVFANIPTRVYVALRNNTPHDLTGTIRFSDNGTRIGSSEVRALSGRLVEAWVDWKPTKGEHRLSAIVSDAELHIIGEETRPIDVAGILAEDTLTVDLDTDGDKIGNETDADDDNDGVLDTDERARGSDPLVANPKVTEKDTEEADEKAPAVSEKTSETAGVERGLEKYIGEGTVDTLLTNVSDKVDGAKDSLDAYRERRNATLYENNDISTSTETLQSYDSATITRSKASSDKSMLSSFVSGVATLLKNTWTFVLFVLSKSLSHPALIQILLLCGILYILYSTARRFGKRRMNY